MTEIMSPRRAVAVIVLAVATTFGSINAQSARRDTAPPHPVPTAPRTPPGRPLHADRVAFIDSLKQPESVLYDGARDVFYVSNIEGASLQKDGRGFITRLRSDGSRETLRWIDGGKNGVILNAPKGMAIAGDTLWVSDIDAMRAFNVRTGIPITSIDLAPLGAVFLNDVVIGGDGAVYVTDTQMKPEPTGNMTHAGVDRVFRVAAGKQPAIALQTDKLQRPNGIAWDKNANRFIIVPFGRVDVYRLPSR